MNDPRRVSNTFRVFRDITRRCTGCKIDNVKRARQIMSRTHVTQDLSVSNEKVLGSLYRCQQVAIGY